MPHRRRTHVYGYDKKVLDFQKKFVYSTAENLLLIEQLRKVRDSLFGLEYNDISSNFRFYQSSSEFVCGLLNKL